MDASLLCLLRCLMHSLFRLQDEYLVSNSCAILHNLAASLTTGMLPYTAERLVRVTCQLCSRAVRACEARVMRGDRAAATAVAGAGSGNQPQPQRVPMFDPRYNRNCRFDYFLCFLILIDGHCSVSLCRNLNVNGTIVAAASSSDLSLASETDPRYSAAGADLREATLLPSAVSALLALLFTALR